MRINNMHTFFVDDLIQLYCLLRVSNNHVFVLRKTCTVHAVCMVLLSCIHMGQSDIDETAPYGCMKVIPYKLHEQVFLRMNTWLFETCRRQYNLIKLSMKKCAFCLFLLHRYITTHGSKTVKFSYLFIYLFIYANWYSFLNIFSISNISGDRGSTVVKMLYYKSDGRWFDPNWCQRVFIYIKSFRSHCGPGVDSSL
jgi:hypothetical protein